LCRIRFGPRAVWPALDRVLSPEEAQRIDSLVAAVFVL
jgi:hypothetical protein